MIKNKWKPIKKEKTIQKNKDRAWAKKVKKAQLPYVQV